MSLSDDDWLRISYLFPQDDRRRFGRPQRPARQVLEAILWVIMNDERWHRLPASFPPSQTCYMRYLQWRKSGALDAALRELGITPARGKCRLKSSSCFKDRAI
jgi:transposase